MTFPRFKSPVKAAIFLTLGSLILGRLLLTVYWKVQGSDPFLWLEEIEGEKVLAWVEEQNDKTREAFAADEMFARFYKAASELLNDKDRIPYARLAGEHAYNFWQDDKNPKGIWRRASLQSYLDGNPQWHVLLDMDDLATKENRGWVFKGADCLAPAYERCLIKLSDGGKDAHVVREFSIPHQAFIDEEGFQVGEAKSNIEWVDEDTVLVGTKVGEGSLTKSGYPRQIRLWRRGQPLEQAKVLLSGEEGDIGVSARHFDAPGEELTLISRSLTFWETLTWVMDRQGNLIELPISQKAEIEAYMAGKLILNLKENWSYGGSTWAQGDLVAVNIEDLLSGKPEMGVTKVFQPSGSQSIASVTRSQRGLFIKVLDDVNGRLLFGSPGADSWEIVPVDLPKMGTIGLVSADARSEIVLASYEDFLVPEALYAIKDETLQTDTVFSTSERFDARKYEVQQRFATSQDGTRVPYYLVQTRDQNAGTAAPTLLYGYGGFDISLTPSYSPVMGQLWLEQGGAYAVANLRGGGEYGPAWHEAGMLDQKQNTFDDFLAVAEHLVATGTTTPEQLGIMGGSNGGLLVGAAMVQRPSLFGAVVCQVPLLDMLRYAKLPPGAIWIGEYGDPEDKRMGSYIAKYSPYQNLAAAKDYPPVLFVTSTKDDRVHPGHARKMTAKLQSLRYEAYLHERTEGGHSATTTPDEKAHRLALEYSFLHKQLTTP